MQSNATCWLLRASMTAAIIGDVGTAAGAPVTRLAGMTSSEGSTLHAALFFAAVWIVSSLRIYRFKTFWRVGFGLKRMRGPSGNLQPRGPKARAATGGSAGGAGTSGVC
ncbi:hypothetical protein [Mesorhizobium tianshanense]|nr:hypothetical protein [Mesorhizobium tianshanense]